jgi:hypothetical protein
MLHTCATAELDSLILSEVPPALKSSEGTVSVFDGSATAMGSRSRKSLPLRQPREHSDTPTDSKSFNLKVRDSQSQVRNCESLRKFWLFIQ